LLKSFFKAFPGLRVTLEEEGCEVVEKELLGQMGMEGAVGMVKEAFGELP
jgi:hypothetical protein